MGDNDQHLQSHHHDLFAPVSSDSSQDSSASVASSESDLTEDVSSYDASSSSSASASTSSITDQPSIEPLHDMSSLLLQLPVKRGLSKHYQGKSQSFTSLSNVRCLEDLARPENPPCSKKLKSCKSYGGGLASEGYRSQPLKTTFSTSRFISKKASPKAGSYCSSLSAKRSASFLGCTNSNRPPIPPHRSTSTSNMSNQTPLFA